MLSSNKNYGIIIQCRDKATRFPLKSVRPFWKGKSILEIIIDKFRYFKCKVIVATSYNSPKTIQICKKMGISYHVAQEDNVAARMWHTAKRYGLKGFFRVCADNPFIQTSFIRTLSNFIKDDHWDYIAFEDCMKRHEGFWAEYIKTDALYLSMFFGERYDLEHVTPYIIRHPEKFKQYILPIPKIMKNWLLRLTVDTASDFYIVRKVYKYMGEECWENIYNWMENKKEIQKGMYLNILRNDKNERRL